MKYKNMSDKVMFFNIGGRFIDVKPGAKIELKGRNIEKKHKELVPIEDTKEETNELVILEEEDLKKLKKDQLNDYAAKIGFDEVNSSMKKDEMVEAILRWQNEEED